MRFSVYISRDAHLQRLLVIDGGEWGAVHL